MAAMKIRLIQSGDYTALFKAFMIPSGLFILGKALTHHFSLFLAESSYLANWRYNTVHPLFSCA